MCAKPPSLINISHVSDGQGKMMAHTPSLNTFRLLQRHHQRLLSSSSFHHASFPSLPTFPHSRTFSSFAPTFPPPSIASCLTTSNPSAPPSPSNSPHQHRLPPNRPQLLILGIETSCDDTGAAVVTGDGRILSEVVSSQADLLAQYGGVFPKMAQGGHAKAIDVVVSEALSEAQIQESDLSAIAVTIGPGLSLCLHVGVKKARSIARVHQLPWVGVHHMEAHALVARLTERDLEFPFLVLLVSGGHNLLLLAQSVGQYIQLGTTIDDAIGEAYDKTARMLGLDMRKGGGPALEELALEGDPNSVKFSVPMRNHRDCNFSYAGLKTQVLLAIESRNIISEHVPLAAAEMEDRQVRADIAASFQRVAVLHLEEKCERAVEWAQSIDSSVKHLVVSGGVASNKVVRSRLGMLAERHRLHLVCPPPRLCTDNGVMVAWAGVEHFMLGRYNSPPPIDEPEDVWLDLRPRWQLGETYAEGLSEARSLKRSHIHPSLTAEVRTHFQQLL